MRIRRRASLYMVTAIVTSGSHRTSRPRRPGPGRPRLRCVAAALVAVLAACQQPSPAPSSRPLMSPTAPSTPAARSTRPPLPGQEQIVSIAEIVLKRIGYQPPPPPSFGGSSCAPGRVTTTGTWELRVAEPSTGSTLDQLRSVFMQMGYGLVEQRKTQLSVNDTVHDVSAVVEELGPGRLQMTLMSTCVDEQVEPAATGARARGGGTAAKRRAWHAVVLTIPGAAEVRTVTAEPDVVYRAC